MGTPWVPDIQMRPGIPGNRLFANFVGARKISVPENTCFKIVHQGNLENNIYLIGVCRRKCPMRPALTKQSPFQ